MRTLEPLVTRGLIAVLGEDPRVQLLCDDPMATDTRLDMSHPAPCVAIVGDSVGSAPAVVFGGWASEIIVLARDATPMRGMLLLAAGVSCLDICSSEDNVVAAIESAARGHLSFVAADGTRVERARRGGEQPLTERESDVLVLLSDGGSYREIAAALEISVATVDKHVQKLLRKLNAPNKQALVGLPVEWLRQGFRPSRG